MTLEAAYYTLDGKTFHGQVARPRMEAPRPVVLIAHAWAGQTEFERDKARKLAELGYVGFALDNYGDGTTGHERAECEALMGPLIEDRATLGRRLLAGVAAARALPNVDATRIAAIGFCFGGLCVLDLARSGEALRAVVSFHGLFASNGLPRQPIPARVLALHGYDDPMVPVADVTALATELTAGGADWQIHLYGGTVHAFTNPHANDAAAGTVYSRRADTRAWQTMQSFLAEALA